MRELGPDDPRVIGEYRLRARLGSGGMGRVYLGLSPAGRAVAIKVVNPELAGDAEFLHRFGQEVAAARAVSGIYTAPVVASGLSEHPPWLATAFVPGPCLEEVVSGSGPLPEAAVWPLLAGLSEALQAIHACGVVHRDLKPGNVLLAADGPRVIDFGISRATDGTMLTAAGTVFGTPGYMSPEQAEGKPAGPASDVFALGCVITYAAGGAGPFGTGTAASVLYRVVHGEPDLDRVPPGLREIVSRCLAKDPAARPTPAALAAAAAGRDTGTGPSAVAFWPRPVATVIGAYQSRLEQETKTAERTGGQQSPYPVTATPAGAPVVSAPQGYSGAQGYPQLQGYQPQGSQPQGSQPQGSQPQAYQPQAYQPQAYQPQGSQPQAYQPQGSQPQGSQPQAYQPQGSQPQGYGGAQASPPPPRGYLPGGPPVAYPQPYPPGRPPLSPLGSPGPLAPLGPRGPLPASMRKAIGLMYAGAAYTVVLAIGVIIVAGAVIAKNPALTGAGAGSGRATVGAVAFVTVVASLVVIGLWLGIAQACRNGKSWARVTGTVLFALHTLGVLGVIANSHSGIGPAKVLGLLGWLIAGGAVVFLWQRPSSAFFEAPAARGRPT
jgi:serine/threonine kinase PknH